MFAGRLEIGLGGNLHVREVHHVSNGHDACRLMYISDIHLRRGRSVKLCRQIMESVRGSRPNAVVLGGDLVDQSSELVYLSDLVDRLGAFGPVFAVGGNHDGAVGMDRVREAVVHGGADWIHDRAARIMHGTRMIVVAGPEAAAVPAADVRILCAHNPRIWKTSRRSGFDLVLAGHLHGCQVVWFQFRDRLFPGAFFYPYNFLNHQSGTTRLVVSRGVSDLVPIRWRCPREVVLCHV